MKKRRVRSSNTTTSPSPRTSPLVDAPVARVSPATGWGRLVLRLGPWPAVVAAILVYANSLSNGFTYDDRPLIAENPRIRHAGDWRAVWLSDWWQPREYAHESNPHRDRLYRPLTLFSFALNYAVHGLNAPWFHATNVLLHAGVCALVWWFARRLLGSEFLAALAAVLFAVHPVHVEAVANVVGRAEILAALFLLLGALALLPRAGLPGIGRTALAALAFWLALLAKETAVCYLGVGLLVVYTRTTTLGQRPRARWWLIRLAVLAAPLALYLPLRYVALGQHWMRDFADEMLNPVAAADGAARALLPLAVLGHYVRLLLVPATLSSDYGLAVLDPHQPLTGATALGLVALLALAVGLAGFLRPRGVWRQVALLTGLFVVSYILIANIVVLIGVALAERLMYWPSVPALLLVALGIREFWARCCLPGGVLDERRRLLGALGVGLLAALALRSVVRNSDWVDMFTLMSADTASYPQSAQLNYGYTLELIHRAVATDDEAAQAGYFREAEARAHAALDVFPRFPAALGALARVQAARGFIDKARETAEAALLLDAAQPDALLVLGYLPGGAPPDPERLRALRADVAARPDDPAALLALGSALLDQGQYAAAREQLQRAADLAPDNVAALRRLGQTLTALDRWAEARPVFERVLALAPEDWTTHANLALVLANLRDHAGAIAHARRAVELKPDDLKALTNLAEAYVRANEKHQALEVYRRIERAFPADDPRKQIYKLRITQLEQE